MLDFNGDSMAAEARFEISYTEVEEGKVIGRGGFGVVRLAKWRNTPVVVKSLQSPTGEVDEKLLREFRKEVGVLERLRPHPNVVQYLGVCTEPPNLYILTELVELGDLHGMLHKRSFSARDKCEFAAGIAAGMLHLHLEEILHCDLAARNVLMTSRAGRFHVKITDFGLSRIGAQYLSQTGFGPVRWMAPEALVDRVFSQAGDVWAYGVLLWEIFSDGEEPYSDTTNYVHAGIQVAQGRTLDPPLDSPPRLAVLMRECWSYAPAQRPTFAEICRITSDVVESFTDDPLVESTESADSPLAFYAPISDAPSSIGVESSPSTSLKSSGSSYGYFTLSQVNPETAPLPNTSTKHDKPEAVQYSEIGHGMASPRGALMPNVPSMDGGMSPSTVLYQSMPSTAPIEALPASVQRRVFRLLSPAELWYTVRAVNRSFQRAAELAIEEWALCSMLKSASIPVVSPTGTQLKAALRRVTRSCLALQSLDASAWDLGPEARQALTDKALEVLPRNIQVLRLDGWTRLTSFVGSASSESLHELSLSGCLQLTDAGLQQIGDKFPCLRKLALAGTRTLTQNGLINGLPKSLESLAMSKVGQDWKAVTNKVISSLRDMPTLRTLTLGSVPKVTKKAAEHLPTTLRELSLRDQQVTFVEKVGSAVPELRSLRLISSPSAKLAADGDMFGKLPRGITELTLVGVGSVSTKHADLLPPNLEVLRISRCASLTSTQMARFPTTLRRLELQDCDSVTTIKVPLGSAKSQIRVFVIEACKIRGDLFLPHLPRGLERLVVLDCPLLPELAPSQVAQLHDACPSLRFFGHSMRSVAPMHPQIRVLSYDPAFRHTGTEM